MIGERTKRASTSNMRAAAFFDVDGTLTSEHVWRGLMDYFKQRNLRRFTHAVYMSTHLPLYFLRRAGLISEGTFRAPWADHLAWYLRGYTPQQADEIWEWIVVEFLPDFWRDDMRAILEAHLQSGNPVMLVSSGPQAMIQRIARELGGVHGIGTRLELKAGHYTGRSLKPICIDQYKASLAKEYMEENNLQVDLSHSTAYADSIADLHLLQMVGIPVAVYPDKSLKEHAKKQNWKIIPEQ